MQGNKRLHESTIFKIHLKHIFSNDSSLEIKNADFVMKKLMVFDSRLTKKKKFLHATKDLQKDKSPMLL